MEPYTLLVRRLSPWELLDLEGRCKLEIESRKRAIDSILSLDFACLDPAFIRVAAGRYDGRGWTPFTYWIRHPLHEQDPVKYHPMTVSSIWNEHAGRIGVYVAGGSTGKPSDDLMRKITGADSELRIVYERLMREHPNLPPVGSDGIE